MICSHPSPDPIHALTDQALEELCRPPVLPVNPDSPEIPRVLSVPQLAQVLQHQLKRTRLPSSSLSLPVVDRTEDYIPLIFLKKSEDFTDVFKGSRI